MLKIVEHQSPDYPPRTQHNAKVADLTVAFAIDFSTAGERLTMSAAGEKYLGIHLSESPRDAARTLYRQMRAMNAKTINVAGNSLATLVEAGWGGEGRINLYVYQVIALVHEHWPIQHVVSGGQTGADTAGLVAAVALGIDATGTLPAGCRRRDVHGHETHQTAESLASEIHRLVSWPIRPSA